jgi:hypothetical protein
MNKSKTQEILEQKFKEVAVGEFFRWLFKNYVIKKKAGIRSLKQNNYFHGVVCGVFGLHFGLTVEEAKQIFKRQFPQYFKYEKRGCWFTKGTKDLNTQESESFFSQCRMWASEEHKCFIPKPNEVTEEIMHELDKNRELLGY